MPDERRLVTVLFADVVGSTSLGEELDPEDVRALLARLFAIARDAVEQRGGRVEKFIGDAVMAVFGVPRAHDDDAARALSAALDLRDRVRADPLLAERVPIRIGVNTGEVIASGDPDATESLVTGDAVNAAARLQQAADPWAILVGDRAVRASGDRFRFGPLVPVAARGRSQPVAARVLEDEDRLPSGLTASRAPLVGRAADLEQLELAARRAFEEARPYLVSIVAPAGVGKSRLLEAFLGHLAPDVRVALAQCLPYGQRLTYWPMRAILLSVLGLGEESAPDAVRAALSTWLQGADESEPERTAELLAATIGGAEAESGDRLALFAAWRRFIELAAERTPLVLVIEDLHWSSDSLLDLIEAILQPRSDVPLLMIALARPELLDRRPGWSGGRRNAISLALEPLADGAVRTLVANLLEAPSPGLTDAVVARAEGNPFYAGEIVRALADRLGPRPDPAAVSAAITALPDTVQATVLARLDMLEPRPRRIVQLGAVMGRTFSAGALATLDPVLDEEAVVEAVDVLIDRDLVRPSGRDQLTFRHILIREVAYGMLPRAERARLHARAGAWLEGQALRAGREEELAELVAFHFREAATLARLIGDVPDPSLAERAVTWLRRAADVADAGAASPEAARHLQAAIELASREAQPDLYERLGQVWIGGEQGLEAFERAHELGRELGLGPDQQLRTIAQLAVVYSRWRGSVGGRLREEETTAWLGEIERLLDRVTTDEARILGYLAIGFGPNRAEHPTPEELASSRAAAEKALELARRADAPNLVSAALDALDVVFLRDDRIADTLELQRERLALGDRLDTAERLDAWNMTLWTEVLLGRLEEAAEAAVGARAGLASGQGEGWVAHATAWRISALYWLGRWDEIGPEADRLERAWRQSEIRAPWFALHGLLLALAVAQARGDMTAAAHWREAATTIFRRSDPGVRSRRMESWLTGDLEALERDVVRDWRVFMGRTDYVALALAAMADRAHRADVGVIDTIVAHSEDRSTLLVSSQARRLRGIVRADEADLASALDSFERMRARPFVARVRTELGALRGDPAMVEAGLAELEALGDLEQATRVAARGAPQGGPATI